MKRRNMYVLCLCIVSLAVVTVCGYVWWNKHSRNRYDIQVSGVAPSSYPAIIGSSLLWYSEKSALRVAPEYPFSKRKWAAFPTESIFSMRDDFPMPTKINLLWLSVAEYKCYYLASDLRPEMDELWRSNVDADGKYMFSHIVVGMAPYGGVAIWMSGSSKSILVDWMHGRESSEVADRFIPKNTDMTLLEFCNTFSPEGQERYRRMHKGEEVEVPDDRKEWAPPPQGLYDGYMQQFRYRYVIRFEDWDEQGFNESDGSLVHWKEPVPGGWKDSLNLYLFWELLFDGTYDKVGDGRLFTYHTAGKPSRLRIECYIRETEYATFFWFDDRIMTDVFDEFYGSDRDADTDFIIRMDPLKNKFELSLHREELAEPMLIPEEAYQILVSKDKYIIFHSENYAQERNAWYW